MTPPDSPDGGWDGLVTVRAGQTEIRLRGRLRGMFDPIDGRYHWYGRLENNDALAKLVSHAPVTAEVATPQGSASGTLGDPDMWGRLRVAGVGKPPFMLPALDQLGDRDEPPGTQDALAGRTSE